MTKLNYTIESPEERKRLVEQILAENPNPNSQYLEYLANYLVMAMEKQERKEKKILTENRLVTINKRETSFEGLISQFENGEDGVYNLMTNDKHVILQPKVSITQKDIEEIKELKQIKQAISYWESRMPLTTGKDRYIIKQTIIDLRKDQYIIKDSYRGTINMKYITPSKNYIPLDGGEAVTQEGRVIPYGASLCDPKVCSAVLVNYSALKEAGEGVFESDTWYFMEDFDKAATAALNNYPVYDKIAEWKVDGLSNTQIQHQLQMTFGLSYSCEYISSLWRKKIPALIASAAEDQYLNWYFLEKQRGCYKKCNRCGKTKIAIGKYFSKNSCSPDGWYSICKDCRSKKKKEFLDNLI